MRKGTMSNLPASYRSQPLDLASREGREIIVVHKTFAFFNT